MRPLRRGRKCFNPRPRAGGDGTRKVTTRSPGVSIHAPARGATGPLCVHYVEAGSVSIHAPARGATRGCPFRRCGYGCFNPRPRAGGDRSPRTYSGAANRFQSTPPRGGRRTSLGDTLPERMFQSTPPRGGRLRSDNPSRSTSTFQSTPPRGGRPQPLPCMSARTQFQSTPPRGGRRTASGLPRFRPWGFNPRPRAGGDPMTQPPLQWPWPVSIHAPARGATSNDGHVLGLVGSFQSTPPRGGRPPG